jgi:hypothetical protein
MTRSIKAELNPILYTLSINIVNVILLKLFIIKNNFEYRKKRERILLETHIKKRSSDKIIKQILMNIIIFLYSMLQ